MKELPRYKCHKEVRAGKIYDCYNAPGGEATLYLMIGGPDLVEVKVSTNYIVKHRPQIGGYYVQYEDGYESWSPAEAFEGGYTRVEG